MRYVRCYDYVDMAKVINNNTSNFDQRIANIAANQVRMNNRFNNQISSLYAKNAALTIVSIISLGYAALVLGECKKTKAELCKLEKRVKEMEDIDFLK